MYCVFCTTRQNVNYVEGAVMVYVKGMVVFAVRIHAFLCKVLGG